MQYQAIHAPAGAEVFTHLENSGADSFNIANIAGFSFPYPGNKPGSGLHVLYGVQPTVKRFGRFDSVHRKMYPFDYSPIRIALGCRHSLPMSL
jgi:hypothetical protein